MKVAAQADLKSPLGKQDLAVSARAFQVPALVILPPNVAKNYRILVVDISIGLRLGKFVDLLSGGARVHV